MRTPRSIWRHQTPTSRMRPKAFLPDKTFSDRMTLLSGKDAVDLYHYGPAHTGGDIFVVFRDDRVMHAGDVFPQPGGMLIDGRNGGSALAVPTTISRAVDGIKNVDRVITGHASVVGWDTFVDYRDFHTLAMEHARAQFAAGKSAEQALAAFNPPEKYKSWRYGQPGATPPPPANVPAGSSDRHAGRLFRVHLCRTDTVSRISQRDLVR